jgi:hypothetical protein
MELSVLHYHFRPGGVRRVIELGLPALARAMHCTRVTLAAGEAPPDDWRTHMEAALHPCAVEWFIEPAFGYWSEQTRPAPEVQAAIREALRRFTAPPHHPLWVHNLSVGRNMLLSREVAALADEAPLWLHHHDWWWDGRWERWPEMQQQGFTSLAEAFKATLPCGDTVRHFCVNLTDARRLSEWTGGDFRFLPNPLTPPKVTAEETEVARAFLRRETGADCWWLYPCRGLRRKNIAEALHFQRGFGPHAVTVTTGGASSAEEEGYFQHLTSAASKNHWPLNAGLALKKDCPPVPALMAATEMVLVTSLREGFGLPLCEAALAGRPCSARIPAGLEETVARLGTPFVNQWHTLPVPRQSYNHSRESAETPAGRERLMSLLPAELHAAARVVSPADGGDRVDFGALSLAGQLEVMAGFVKQGASFTRGRPEVPPPYHYPWTPEKWARGFGQSPSLHSWRAGWEESGVSVTAPLLHHWLKHPLLWPDATAAGACK